MRLLIGLAILGLLGGSALAAPVRVRGYVRPGTGVYVAPHVKSAPDHTRLNNYSTKPNVNPFTGRKGRKGAGN